MNLPVKLRWIIAILAAAGIVGFGFSVWCPASYIPKAITDISIVLTLIVLIIYVHHTFLIAKEAWTASAAIFLQQTPNDPYHILVLINNSSKFPLDCWCKLNPTVYGNPVSMERFYGGKSVFIVQPHCISQGHFEIKELLTKANKTIEIMEKDAQVGDKHQLYFDVEFWYFRTESDQKICNPKQPYFFDFKRKKLVLDF